jgi:hypothetical protein
MPIYNLVVYLLYSFYANTDVHTLRMAHEESKHVGVPVF